MDHAISATEQSFIASTISKNDGVDKASVDNTAGLTMIKEEAIEEAINISRFYTVFGRLDTMLGHLPSFFHMNQRVIRSTFYTVEEFLEFAARLMIAGFSILYFNSPVVNPGECSSIDDLLALYYEEVYNRPENPWEDDDEVDGNEFHRGARDARGLRTT